MDIYHTDDNDGIIRNSCNRKCYGNRTIGVKRYFAARQNDIELNQVIQVHRDMNITPEDAAVIGGTRYQIIQVQHFSDTNPPVSVLSLEQRGLFTGGDDGVS